MTRDDWKALGLRALAAGFRVMPAAPEDREAGFILRGTDGVAWDDSGTWPDLSDPATLGVLEAQLMARGGIDIARGGGWFEVASEDMSLCLFNGATGGNCPNYETALVRALEGE